MSDQPLHAIKDHGVITRVEGGIKDLRRLASLGLAPGRKVKVHVNSSVMIIEVDNSVLVLDRQLASKIMVGAQHED
ncbi:MAG: FeoA family protein [Candidatus Baldrarchaeia archaeon]|nr:FeoA family protein [Candidatus Baldrarchaeota archaeon]